MRPLRIAFADTAFIESPAPEPIVWSPLSVMEMLARGLAQRGHEVTMYAAQGSKAPDPAVRLITPDLPPLRSELEKLLAHQTVNQDDRSILGFLWDQKLLSDLCLAAKQGAYDIIHLHNPQTGLSLGRLLESVPVVYTLHGPMPRWRDRIYRLLSSPNQFFIAISDAQRQTAPELPYAARIYHGLEIDKMPFSGNPGSYLLFVGRILPEKGVHHAVTIARRTGEKLVLVGPRYPEHEAYWQEHIEPYLGKTIIYHGYQTPAQTLALYQGAKATLFPIEWEEPFGLVMIESMACGTPIIGMRRAAVPEVIIDGKTGFIASSVEEMITAVQKIDTIDRRACRQHVAENFNSETVIKNHEKTYYDILKKAQS